MPRSAFHRKKPDFNAKLAGLHAVGKVDLQGLSLVTKFSQHLPELLITCDESGFVYVINSSELELKKNMDIIQPMNLNPKKEYKCGHGAIFDVEWHDESRKFLIASGQSNCLLWDAETGEKVFQSNSISSAFKTIKSCSYNNNIFASGGRDGRLILWDCRSGKSGNMQINEVEIDESKTNNSTTYTGICFYNDEKTLITSQDNTDNVKIWDLRKISLDRPRANIFKTKHKKPQFNSGFTLNQDIYFENKMRRLNEEAESMKVNVSSIDYSYFLNFQTRLSDFLSNLEIAKNQTLKGIGSIALNRKQNRLMVNSIDHTIILYDLNSIDFQKPREFKGHKTSYYVKSVLSPCSEYILSGSTDHNLYLWKTDEKSHDQKPIIVIKNAHNGEINGVDWGLGSSNFIASSGDDKNLLIWDYS